MIAWILIKALTCRCVFVLTDCVHSVFQFGPRARLMAAWSVNIQPDWNSTVMLIELSSSSGRRRRSSRANTNSRSPRVTRGSFETYTIRPFLPTFIHPSWFTAWILKIHFSSLWRTNSTGPPDKLLSGLPPCLTFADLTNMILSHIEERMFPLSPNLKMKLSACEKLSQVFTEAEGRMRKYHP